MCGRITQKSNPHVLALKVATLIEPLPEGKAVPPRFNGAPGQQHWVIRQHPKTGERHLDRLWWGLIPYWTKEASPKLKPINATADRVATAPMFRAAYAKRRCLVPVDNFFEWIQAKGKGPKQPYAIGMKSGEPFALAGIWESWRHPETGEIFRSFCVVTTDANELLAAIHHRMPVILDPASFDRWLSPLDPDPRDLLVPYPAELMMTWPISTRINKADNDDAAILDRASPSEPGTPSLL
jgi:putative SOS response-associated peptidase YedK